MSKEFFEKYPKVLPTVQRFEKLDSEQNIIESWERDANGEMVNVTERDKLRLKISRAKEDLLEITHTSIMFPNCPIDCQHFFSHSTMDGDIYVCNKLQKRCDSTIINYVKIECPLSIYNQRKLLSQEERYERINQ